MVERYCFWCGEEFSEDIYSKNFTRDHIVPASLKGGEGENLVASCRQCNEERGKVLNFAYLMVEIVETGRTAIRPKTAAIQLRIAELWKKWSEIEFTKLGWSFTHDLDVNIPEGVEIKERPRDEWVLCPPSIVTNPSPEEKGAYHHVMQRDRNAMDRIARRNTLS